MKVKEYTVPELSEYIESLRSLYDIVRLVAPESCRVIELDHDCYAFGKKCFGCWERSERCRTCTSAMALKTSVAQGKVVIKKSSQFSVYSVPVRLRGANDVVFPCVIEMVTTHRNSIPVTYTDDRQDTLIVPAGAAVQDSAAGTEQFTAARIDPLTGLPSWAEFCQTTRDIFIRSPSEPWVIVMTDIWKFGLVNELFGIESGNAILRGMADALRDSGLRYETICRRGSDHFIMCFKSGDYIESRLCDILQKLSSMFTESVCRIFLQAGVYRAHDLTMPLSSMCDRAKLALNAIKEKTKVMVSEFDQDMLDRLVHEQHVLSSFRPDLEAGEFQVYLQPQVDREGAIKGAEALVRWIKPDGTIVPPDSFIGILERSCLISDLDRMVWDLAAGYLAAWKNIAGKDFYISVNISPLDFFHIDVLAYFEHLVRKYGIDKKSLHLEITESFMMSDTEKQLRIADRLMEAGWILEIDDFGKGYSSLGELKDLNFNTLKIDKSFIDETENQERSRAILESVFDMTKKLRMEVITEGVERKEQVERLSAMGCKTFQGYYFDRPLPVPDFISKYLSPDA